MKNQASSFRAERASRQWFREPWPWVLMAGPGIVVVACLGTAWLALRSDDGLVATDYYKQGLMINRMVPRAADDPARGVGALVAVTATGEVRARLEGVAAPPGDVRLRLTRVGGGDDELVRLARAADGDGDYVGILSAPPSGRWIVTLESRAWRLPTTITDQLSEVRLGIAEPRARGAE